MSIKRHEERPKSRLALTPNGFSRSFRTKSGSGTSNFHFRRKETRDMVRPGNRGERGGVSPTVIGRPQFPPDGLTPAARRCPRQGVHQRAFRPQPNRLAIGVH